MPMVVAGQEGVEPSGAMLSKEPLPEPSLSTGLDECAFGRLHCVRQWRYVDALGAMGSDAVSLRLPQAAAAGEPGSI